MTLRIISVASLTMVTFAFATVAPDESVTVPAMRPKMSLSGGELHYARQEQYSCAQNYRNTKMAGTDIVSSFRKNAPESGTALPPIQDHLGLSRNTYFPCSECRPATGTFGTDQCMHLINEKESKESMPE